MHATIRDNPLAAWVPSRAFWDIEDFPKTSESEVSTHHEGSLGHYSTFFSNITRHFITIDESRTTQVDS